MPRIKSPNSHKKEVIKVIGIIMLSATDAHQTPNTKQNQSEKRNYNNEKKNMCGNSRRNKTRAKDIKL